MKYVLHLLEDGLSGLLHKGADSLPLELPALDGLLAHVEVLRLCHRRALDRSDILQKRDSNEQALVSLKLKKTVDAEVGRTFAVRIEGG